MKRALFSYIKIIIFLKIYISFLPHQSFLFIFSGCSFYQNIIIFDNYKLLNKNMVEFSSWLIVDNLTKIFFFILRFLKNNIEK